MASKRTLYKPVNQEVSSGKVKRKTLAQGRLVTKATSADNLTETGRSVKPSRHVSTSGSVPRLAVLTHSARNSPAGVFLAENNVTPRKNIPGVVDVESPRQVQPTHSLDLSDTETETETAVRMGVAPEVLVVDASRQLKSLDDTEVDIAVHLGHSQAKVVCHTPEKTQLSHQRTSGSVAEAAKVSVDKIPSLCFAEQEDGERRQMPIIKQPMVVRENGLPAAAVPHFRALMALNEQSKSSFESDQAGSDGSRTESEQSVMPQEARKPHVNTKCVTIDDDITLKVQAMKKASSKVVPSRYMQASRGPMKAVRSLAQETSTTRSKASASGGSSLASRNCLGGSLNRTSVTDFKVKAASLNLTPSDPRITYGGQSSTPNVTGASSNDGSLFQHAADLSVIGPCPALDIGDKSMNLRLNSLSNEASGGSRNGSTTQECVLKNLKSRSSANVTQWDLELLYGRVIQWAFLESRARKCLRDQEKQAMTQLHDLFELTERQRKRNADIELKLANVKHINTLDEALELQSAGLNAPMSRLSHLKDQYAQLAEALDTTRHHMPTKGLYIPREGKEEFIDELCRALHESEKLLGELSVMTRKDAAEVGKCANLLGATEVTVEREVAELSRLQVLLETFSSQLTQENVLKVGQTYAK